jgi:hypothetical protein
MPVMADRQIDRLGELVSVLAGAEAWTAPEAVLRKLDTCWPDVAWSFSRLTADGFPFELSFVGTDCTAAGGSRGFSPGLRWTAEVAGPEVATQERLRQAVDWIAATGTPIDAAAENLRDLQQGACLRWGAWLGGRYRDGRDSFKVYAEAPRRSSSGGLRMIGFDCDRQLVERYYRPGRLRVSEVEALLARAGLAGRTEELLDVVSACTGWPARPELPGANFGVSVASDADGNTAAVAVIAFARYVFGVDPVARRCILGLADRFGWDMSGYELVTRAVEGRWSSPSSHTMVSWLVAPDEAVRTTIGVRPLL